MILRECDVRKKIWKLEQDFEDFENLNLLPEKKSSDSQCELSKLDGNMEDTVMEI
jgi:hypothetical protein